MFYDLKLEISSCILLGSVHTLWSKLVVLKADKYFFKLIFVGSDPKVSLERLVLVKEKLCLKLTLNLIP